MLWAMSSGTVEIQHRNEELESAYLYRVLAESERDPGARALFAELALAAEGQAAIWEARAGGPAAAPPFRPAASTRVVAALSRRLGARRMRAVLAARKVRGLSYFGARPGAAAPGHGGPEQEAGRHRSAEQGSNLRAAVFGVSDGIVSNASLILGVSGANADPRTLVIAGLAGLLAGASSMAAGEYISVRSQRELFQHQIGLERAELALYPEEEEAELATIYRARGLTPAQAAELARSLMSDPEHALDTLARDELGLDPSGLASPLGAALWSFLAFALGALLPLVPLWVLEGPAGLWASGATAAGALFGVGALLSFFTGKSALWSGARLALIGGAAAAATYGVGRLFGVATG
jgi:VIT1/CCC1 family predicted Fe2+/Mn2+ transporter